MKTSPTPEEVEKRRRKLLFIPCKSKEHLKKWIEEYLELEMPDCIVDPESNSSPMDMIWEYYSKALYNNDPNFSRVLYYASRDSYKTLSAAIIEVLCVFHLDRDVGHMAAQDAQSQRAQSYVKSFVNKKTLREFKVGENLKEVDIVRYYDPKTKESITEKEWKSITDLKKDNYVRKTNKIKIIICTMQGVNSYHCESFLEDEIDVVSDKKAYQDAKMIPAPKNGKLPITLLTSTRKFSFGLVQKEIDNAVDEDGEIKLHIRKWNLIDVTEKCPPSRCLPDLPKIPIYVDDDKLRAISKEKYDKLNDADKKNYVEEQGYQGCLSNCKLFAPCRGRLYTIQKSTSPLLRPINHTINQFRDIELENAKAQLLCRKPGSEGLIYTALERSAHMKTAAELGEMLLGSKIEYNFSKLDLLNLLKTRDDWKFYAGMDFGYTHNFAVVTGVADGYRCFILDVISEPNLLPDRQISICDMRIKRWNPTIFADPENPQMVDALKAAGFKMKKWDKGKGSLVGGIDIVRLKLREPLGEPTLFFLAGDPGVELLFKRMSSYHWKLNPDGEIGNEPDEEDDDECDALRYLIMNKFASKAGKTIRLADSKSKSSDEIILENPDVWTKDNMYSKILQENGIISDNPTGFHGSEGGLKWSF